MTVTRKKTDPRAAIVERFLVALRAGTAPWLKTWADGLPRNLASRKAYRGINVFMLGMAADEKGYTSPYWLTFKQAKAKGGSVRKGEKGTQVVFWKILKRTEKAEDGSTTIKGMPLLRLYTVFNVEQCEGIEAPEAGVEREHTPCEAAERAFQTYRDEHRIGLLHSEPRAFYSPAGDFVNMPRPETFITGEAFYSTLAHELAHSTGHELRLARPGVMNATAFGSHAYGVEELTAEMASAMVLGDLGLGTEDTEANSAAYLQSWLKAISEDPSMILKAAQAAQKAADLIMAPAPKPEPVA